MSRVLPILFNTDMVRAILDGRKTATRRLVKLPKYIQLQDDGLYTLFADGTCYENQHMEDITDYFNKPYQPGDTLYVRETWKLEEFYDAEALIRFRAGGEIDIDYECEGSTYSKLLKYVDDIGWQPSLFMPKEAARIWLKVKDVRVERLKEIEPVDVIKEGAYPDCCDCLDTYGESGSQCCYKTDDECSQCDSVMMEWEKLWNSTIKKSDLDRYGWDANPWVWVIEFERCEKPEVI